MDPDRSPDRVVVSSVVRVGVCVWGSGHIWVRVRLWYSAMVQVRKWPLALVLVRGKVAGLGSVKEQ